MTTHTDIRIFSSRYLDLVFEVDGDGDVRLLALRPTGEGQLNLPENNRNTFRVAEIHCTGENHETNHDCKRIGTNPGKRLRLLRWEQDDAAGTLAIVMRDDKTGAQVSCHYVHSQVAPVVRTWTEVKNTGSDSIGVEYLTSFALTGLDLGGLGPRDAKMRLHIPHSTWFGEAQWRAYRLPELGLSHLNEFSMKRIQIGSTGTWSTAQYAPTAILENTETARSLFWQIENNGQWQWEISDVSQMLYLRLSGPTETEHHWWQSLEPGESFTSVPACVGVVDGGFNSAIAALTDYRRDIRRDSQDNVQLPVIFNDYMNCLFGDPTTEKLLPLIDRAAEAGCEYFCVDCGWYSDGPWWDGVGEWLPSKERFPNGIKEVLDHIRRRGMIPGLWLEIEVMGIRCPLADELPDSWFFMRHGKRVTENGRYQLDFKNVEVRNHADSVMDRLVRDYGAGYIKMDYNINAGVGTELGVDSFGEGLLEHTRAYLVWLDAVFARYPDLVIENCSSGGLRMDYALLQRHSIQSSSDQTDYRKNGVVAASAASLCTPEQLAVWSYPLRHGDREEVIFNMVNAMLLRIHQSGHMVDIDDARFALVKEGIATYKTLRADIPQAHPFWPQGIPNLESPWFSFALVAANVCYVSVWRMDGPDQHSVDFPQLAGQEKRAELIYPRDEVCEHVWFDSIGRLSVVLPNRYSARVFRIQ